MATESTLSYPDNAHPTRFTQAQLEWLPWLEPLPEAMAIGLLAAAFDVVGAGISGS